MPTRDQITPQMLRAQVEKMGGGPDQASMDAAMQVLLSDNPSSEGGFGRRAFQYVQGLANLPGADTVAGALRGEFVPPGYGTAQAYTGNVTRSLTSDQFKDRPIGQAYDVASSLLPILPSGAMIDESWSKGDYGALTADVLAALLPWTGAPKVPGMARALGNMAPRVSVASTLSSGIDRAFPFLAEKPPVVALAERPLVRAINPEMGNLEVSVPDLPDWMLPQERPITYAERAGPQPSMAEIAAAEGPPPLIAQMQDYLRGMRAKQYVASRLPSPVEEFSKWQQAPSTPRGLMDPRPFVPAWMENPSIADLLRRR